MTDEVMIINSSVVGPISTILVGVHGNETCGVRAIEGLLPSLHIEQGQVFIICGNPEAVSQKKRFIDTDLNRLFRADGDLSSDQKRSYEYKRSQLIKTYLDQSEVLLDVHASRTPNSPPFLIAEDNAREITTSLAFDLVVSGFDKLEPGGTDSYMNTNGRIGICAECGYTGNEVSIDIALKCIIDFLIARGHISGNTSKVERKYIEMSYIYKTKTANFSLTQDFSDFEMVTKGQVIGSDGEEKICTPFSGYILFARNGNKIDEEAFLMGKEKSPA